jgi:hypothetical protein
MLDEKVYLPEVFRMHVTRKGAVRMGIYEDRRYNQGSVD